MVTRAIPPPKAPQRAIFLENVGWVRISHITRSPASIHGVVGTEMEHWLSSDKKDGIAEGGASLGAWNIEERFLAYSLFGAWQNYFLLTKFFSEHFGDRPLDVADMGGGSCCLAVELALSGSMRPRTRPAVSGFDVQIGSSAFNTSPVSTDPTGRSPKVG